MGASRSTSAVAILRAAAKPCTPVGNSRGPVTRRTPAPPDGVLPRRCLGELPRAVPRAPNIEISRLDLAAPQLLAQVLSNLVPGGAGSNDANAAGAGMPPRVPAVGDPSNRRPLPCAPGRSRLDYQWNTQVATDAAHTPRHRVRVPSRQHDDPVDAAGPQSALEPAKLSAADVPRRAEATIDRLAHSLVGTGATSEHGDPRHHA